MQGEKPTSESSSYLQGKAYAVDDVRPSSKDGKGHDDPRGLFSGPFFIHPEQDDSWEREKSKADPFLFHSVPDFGQRGISWKDEVVDLYSHQGNLRWGYSWLLENKGRPYFLMDGIIGSIPGFTDDVTKTTKEDADILCLTAWVTGYLRLEAMSGHRDITNRLYSINHMERIVKLKEGTKWGKTLGQC